jgi:disulfide bond formation protein DsbB
VIAAPRSPRLLMALATLGVGATLAASLGFQHLGGLAPCDLCLWQRHAHAAALALGLAAPVAGRWAALAAALVLIGGATVAGYQVGLEQDWWEGFTACSAPISLDLSPEAMIERLRAAPIVRCDAVRWSLFGVSMAGWNVPLSVGLAGLFGAAYSSSSASQYR